MEMLIGLLAVLGIFMVCPLVVFGFLYLNKKLKTDLQKMESQKEILALEIQKERLMLERMDTENKMLDKKINEIEKSGV